ncbi:DUF938 domain-containing protein [Marinicella meishanensis]|uniref:DUF938 domain-containing protein n=1 Tax=Marinicella meishanensis TaxID=2873263 RepID=UPI001CBAFC2E|nr:DUF938 domain-containing protein [Marinicella sp. NBU2979]
MTTDKPFAPACERNQAVILESLRQHLRPGDRRLFEVGSGTGQHAVFMAPQLPQLTWQTSDVAANHAGIQQWLDEVPDAAIIPPVQYTIGQDPWPMVSLDVVFTANTLHIISAALIANLCLDLGHNLEAGNRLFIYGPFKYGGQFTTASNAEFDQWLKERDPDSGIRDIEWLTDLLTPHGIQLLHDLDLPANNQMLIYQKS